ncbi:MAG: hypothetical protein D6E12_13610 [Desulfovibrio sp.]|nr:MAG: hypothetical protein D6E12_13610 [Desulfovibrio sp.]
MAGAFLFRGKWQQVSQEAARRGAGLATSSNTGQCGQGTASPVTRRAAGLPRRQNRPVEGSKWRGACDFEQHRATAGKELQAP